MAPDAEMSALIRRLWSFGLALIVTGVASAAGAEPEVRILLKEGVADLEVTGRGLRMTRDDEPPVRWPSNQLSLSAGSGRVRAGDRAARRVIVTGADTLEVGGRPYLGRMEVVAASNRLTVVNRLAIETYLLGIVGSEMPAEWPLEALKAQAVAARTYALQRRLRERAAGRPFDLRDSVLSQVYRGADSIRPSVIAAVRETAGIVLTFRHEPAEALFHSTCGGHTLPSEAVFGSAVPYLRGRPCPWCRESHRHRWSLTLDAREIRRLLDRVGLSRGLERLEREGEEAPVWIYDQRGRRAVEPEKIRAAFGYGRLYSTRFEIDRRGDRVRLSGAGFGHRVGMCQWGARGMAAAGKSFREILRHYYDGAELKRAY